MSDSPLTPPPPSPTRGEGGEDKPRDGNLWVFSPGIAIPGLSPLPPRGGGVGGGGASASRPQLVRRRVRGLIAEHGRLRGAGEVLIDVSRHLALDVLRDGGQ